MIVNAAFCVATTCVAMAWISAKVSTPEVSSAVASIAARIRARFVALIPVIPIAENDETVRRTEELDPTEVEIIALMMSARAESSE